MSSIWTNVTTSSRMVATVAIMIMFVFNIFVALDLFYARNDRNDQQSFLNFIDSDSDTRSLAAIKIRKECIDAIRSKHFEALLDIVQKPQNADHPSKVLLVDPAYHENVGDSMLTVAEQTFLHNIGWEKPNIFECNYVQARRTVPECKTNIVKFATEAKVALWHAGGNWGDLWMSAQTKRIQSFSPLLKAGFTVVSMPQSLYYANSSIKLQHAEEIKVNTMNGLNVKELDSLENQALSQSKLILTWREKESYEQGKTLYPFATNKLVPDIAFQLGPFEPIRPKSKTEMVDIVIFLRDDKESRVSLNDRLSIQDTLNNITHGHGLTKPLWTGVVV